MFEVVISLFLRFSGAIAKLILMLYLAKFSDPETLGQFGVIVAIIAIASQVVGLDVHYFNSRIISSEEKNLVSKTIMSQLFLHLLTYIVLIPILVSQISLLVLLVLRWVITELLRKIGDR